MDDPTDFSAFTAQATVNPPPFNLRFYTEAMEHPGKSAEAGRRMFVDVDLVEIRVPGSKDVVVRKAEDKAKQDQYVNAAYQQWLKTKVDPVDGTPLSEAPFLRPSEIADMKAVGVMTIENLASLSDAYVQRVGIHGVKLRDKARAFLESAKDSALVLKQQEELAKRDRDIAALQDQIKALNARFEAAQKANAA